MSDALQSQLQTYYTRAFLAKQQVRVTHFASLEPGGMEHEMYAFDVEYGAAGERQQEGLILRLYPGDAAYATSAHEFHGMRRLYEAGYPVPQVLLLERDHSPFGKPFVMMERIEGQELGSLLFSAPAEQQRRLLTLFCDLLVRLHALDWRPFVDDVAWVLLVVSAIWGAEWRDRILREYEYLAGAEVEQIEFFEVGACLRFLFILIVSTSRGMHPNAEYMMQVGAFKRAYDLLQERTGIRWVEVERLLTSLS